MLNSNKSQITFYSVTDQFFAFYLKNNILYACWFLDFNSIMDMRMEGNFFFILFLKSDNDKY